MKTEVKGNRVQLLLGLALFGGMVAMVTSAHADGGARERAKRELAPYFKSEVRIRAALVGTSGPEWTEKLFNTKLFGCPAAPVAPAEATKEITFRTGRAGAWAGAVDGINTVITTPEGLKGGGFAVPSNSTARLSEANGEPELRYLFDGTLNVKRALIDAAAAAFDRCYDTLPPGSYTRDELIARCPYREVTRDEQRQTCVATVEGVIGKPLADGTGFVGTIVETTMCDFVGYGRSGDTKTSFTPCYYHEYEGVATLSTELGSPSPEALQARGEKQRMMKVCGGSKRGRGMRPGRMRACVAREMAVSRAR